MTRKQIYHLKNELNSFSSSRDNSISLKPNSTLSDIKWDFPRLKVVTAKLNLLQDKDNYEVNQAFSIPQDFVPGWKSDYNWSDSTFNKKIIDSNLYTWGTSFSEVFGQDTLQLRNRFSGETICQIKVEDLKKLYERHTLRTKEELGYSEEKYLLYKELVDLYPLVFFNPSTTLMDDAAILNYYKSSGIGEYLWQLDIQEVEKDSYSNISNYQVDIDPPISVYSSLANYTSHNPYGFKNIMRGHVFIGENIPNRVRASCWEGLEKLADKQVYSNLVPTDSGSKASIAGGTYPVYVFNNSATDVFHVDYTNLEQIYTYNVFLDGQLKTEYSLNKLYTVGSGSNKKYLTDTFSSLEDFEQNATKQHWFLRTIAEWYRTYKKFKNMEDA